MSWFPRWRAPPTSQGQPSYRQAGQKGHGPVGFCDYPQGTRPTAPSAPTQQPIRHLQVQWGRQRLSLRLPRKPAGQPLTLADLKEEVQAATGVPYGTMQVFVPSGLMRDDQAPLTQYRLQEGDTVTLVGQPLRRRPPSAASGASGARGGGGRRIGAAAAPAPEPARPTPEFEAQQAAAAARKAAEADTSEAGVKRRIEAARLVAEVDLVPEMEQVERSVEAIAVHGLEAARDVSEVPPSAISLTGPNAPEAAQGSLNVHQLVLECKKISELLLRQLIALDTVAAPSDDLRAARKNAVRQVQAMLDRVDAAWTRAKSLGVKPDM